MRTVTQTLKALDTKLDDVELLIRELPLSMRDEARLCDMLYAMYETAEASVESVEFSG